MANMEEAVALAVRQCFKVLLSEKHLYQSIEVDIKPIRSKAEELWTAYAESSFMSPKMRSHEQFMEDEMCLVHRLWIPDSSTYCPERIISNRGHEYVEFALPTINTFCATCDHSPPHNSVSDVLICLPGGEGNQWFFLGYECQQCKGLPVRFLIRREGLKLRLAGRDPIEILTTPKVLPKIASRYYSDAQIAHHAGQTLAGLFLLRVFIEQFWRALQPVKDLLKTTPRATGEEQGEIYQATLPTSFKERFPSLKEIYGQLSAALHSADANAKLFDDSCSKIVKHFDARRLFELT